MTIIGILRAAEPGSVLADEAIGVVRLWTLAGPFRDGRTMRVLRKYFPSLQVRGEMIRLGGWRSLVEAHHPLAEAKMTSSSPMIQRLVRCDVPESLTTLRHIA